MRKSAIAAILAVTTVPLSLVAADDFSALLADLSFGDAASLRETAADQPLAVAGDQTAADLQPVPTGLTMPDMIETSPESTEVAAEPGAPMEVEGPKVALQDPIPHSTPEPLVRLDMEAVMSATDAKFSRSEIPAQAVGHSHAPLAEGCCDSGIVCRPHHKAHLPSSTLLQYFRSNACNTNVWDGYYQSCGSHLKHLNGQCDCFKERGECGCDDRASCDGGCQR